MPLYEYRCDSCGSVFEIIQKFSDEPLTVHQNCGGAVHRLLSAPALQFKGTGWYITDYAKGNGTSSSKASSSESQTEGKTESKKTEGKTESKPSGSTSSTSSASSSAETKK